MPKGKNKIDKSKAYAWVAYMFTHESAEIKRLLKYGTPSDRLISLAEKPVRITLADGEAKFIVFPMSLNKAAGQKLLYNAAVRINVYIKTIPTQAYDIYQDVLQTVTHRRKDTLSNIRFVAEALCHRAASEFKHEILFAYDSIITWVKTVYDKDLGYLTIRKALEALQESGHIVVREWGIRGNRSKCTKIELIPLGKEYILTYTSKVDSWMDSLAHAMIKVYARESTTRQDVLEERIHHYADELANEELNTPAWAPVRGLFGTTDDTMSVAEASSAPMTVEEFLHEVHTNRLLGRLVPTVQANGSDYRGSSTILRQHRSP